MELRGEYKGYTVTISDLNDDFCADIDGSTVRSQTLDGIKKRIDTIERKNFVQTDVIVSAGWGGESYKKAVVTSHYDNTSVWIKDAKGKRSKEPVLSVFYDTEANTERVRRIQEKVKEMSVLRDKIKEIRSDLEVYIIDEKID